MTEKSRQKFKYLEIEKTADNNISCSSFENNALHLFFIKLSSKRFGIPALLKTKSLYGFFFLNLFFDEFTLVRFKVCSSNFEVNFFTDEAVPKLFKNYSNLTADFFWDSFLIIHKKHHRLLHLQDSTPHSKYGLLQKY